MWWILELSEAFGFFFIFLYQIPDVLCFFMKYKHLDKNLEKKIIIIIIIIITLRTFTNDMITLELWLFFWPNMNKRKHQKWWLMLMILRRLRIEMGKTGRHAMGFSTKGFQKTRWVVMELYVCHWLTPFLSFQNHDYYSLFQ